VLLHTRLPHTHYKTSLTSATRQARAACIYSDRAGRSDVRQSGDLDSIPDGQRTRRLAAGQRLIQPIHSLHGWLTLVWKRKVITRPVCVKTTLSLKP